MDSRAPSCLGRAVVTELSAGAAFAGPGLLRSGLTSVKEELLPRHPLELSERDFQASRERLQLCTLRNVQGLFAPLRLQMELRAARQVRRLPFLPSSDLALDVLRGQDDALGFEDVLNDPAQSEQMGEPHAMVERQLGLL